MKLKGRLKAIADMVPGAECLADIGTDHGFLPAYLVQKGTVSRAIAADISKGSLDKARKLVRQLRLEDRIETRLGSGLSVLKAGEADIIVIAGMGGILISEILAADEATARSASGLILQPMTAQRELRQWLAGHGYAIFDEELVADQGRIYEIMAVRSGSQDIDDELYLDIGRCLIEKRHPLLREHLERKMKKAAEIMAELEQSGSAVSTQRAEEYRDMLRRYKEVYDDISG
ncbi:MAG TPA: class I SAM-dependent methyltransferase [Candidatus Atribacteria bacterium]|nr:class I SAM-dependent methyltransferase [Candidatus Atribacteria bacterium]